MRTHLTASDRVVLLLALIPYLQDHGPTSILELAEAFDVEAKTLRNLAEFLGTAGVPGETQTYQHEDLFDIDWNALEQDDVLSLVRVVAVDDTPRFAAAETAALLAGLHVLAPMLPENDAHAVRSAAAKLGGETVGEYAVVSVAAELQDPQLASVTEAITSGKRLVFQYRDAGGGETTRHVEPLQLAQSGELWYLRAFCLDRGEERTFRLDRMTGAQMQAVPAERRAERSHDVATPDASVWSGALVILRVREGALSSLAGYGAEILEATAGTAVDGWARVSVELAHFDTAARLAAAAPGSIIVESPEAARASVAAWAERALSQYDD